MPDREMVIKAWETVLSRDPLDVAWDLIDDTITLLKGAGTCETNIKAESTKRNV